MAVVDRGDQKGPGLFLAYALAGVAFGLILAVTTLSLRTTTGGPFRRVALSGMILAGAITITPWLKYPPNPPAVGNPDTVVERERYYVLAIVLGALLLAGAAHVSARLRRAGWPESRRVTAIVLGTLLGFAILCAALPRTRTRSRPRQPRLAVPDRLAHGQPVGLDPADPGAGPCCGPNPPGLEPAADQNSMPFGPRSPRRRRASPCASR
jgi:hypothetical protein